MKDGLESKLIGQFYEAISRIRVERKLQVIQCNSAASDLCWNRERYKERKGEGRKSKIFISKDKLQFS